MSEETMALAAVPFLRLDEAAGAYLQGSRCANCGAVAPGDRSVCNACTTRGRMESVRLSEHGRLCSYTIVHRSFPGVKTPFVAVIVDLAEGGSLKGTLLDHPADPRQLPSGMPLRIVFRNTGQSSPEGRPFLSYYFVPVGAQP
jgi:uncharacterized OB-fold protein